MKNIFVLALVAFSFAQPAYSDEEDKFISGEQPQNPSIEIDKGPVVEYQPESKPDLVEYVEYQKAPLEEYVSQAE